MSRRFSKVQKKRITEFDILTSHSPTTLKNMVNDLIKSGWEVNGSLNVLMNQSQNRFRGTQHVDTINQFEYSISMVKY